jgi:transcriptional regulator of acetoin/glycerol metabolism
MWLQIFLITNVFLAGVVVALAIRHAIAHYHQLHAQPAKKPAPEQIQLSPVVRAQLLAKAQSKFQEAIDASAEDFQGHLSTTSTQLTKVLEKFGTQIVKDEMELFRSRLVELRTETEQAIHSAQAEFASHEAELQKAVELRRKELEQTLQTELATQKENLDKQIDEKLSDAVVSFLEETLGHNVDLGAQSSYLMAQLEEHKELFKEAGDETTPSA